MLKNCLPMPFILKRILHHPKEPLMEIGAPSVYKPYAHEKILAEKEIIFSGENKAKELVLASGSKITKEMLDQMEFSSSDSDDSSAESDSQEQALKKPIENLDKVAAQEIKVQTEQEIHSSTDDSEKSTEDEMDLEKELVKKFDSQISIKEINDFSPGESFISDFAENEIQKSDQATPEETVEEIDQNNTQKDEIHNQKIENQIITEEVYQYQPTPLNDLSAKILLERVREEFHCTFLDKSGDDLVLNDLFKREYAPKFLILIDEELEQPDLSNKFRTSLLDLKNTVLHKFQDQKRKEMKVSYTLDQILQIKERKEIKLNIDKSLFVVSYRRERREDSVSLFRFELNRIAWTNANAVIDRIKKLKIFKDSEMKQMAEIIFEKAISEDAFCKLYAHVVQNIYRIYKSEEEKKRNETNTVFFSTLIDLFQDIFHKKEKWASQININDLSAEERLSMQNQLEDENIIKEKKKSRMLGAVKFVSFLYSQNIIGYRGISFCINSLLNFEDEQNVETLCALLTNCGEKIAKSDKHQELVNIVNQLKQSYQWSNRIRFMVSDVLEQCDLWLKEKKKSSPFKNAFSALQQNLKNDSEITPLSSQKSSITQNENKEDVFESPKKSESQLKEIKENIVRIVEDIPEVNDYMVLIEEMKKKTERYDSHLIFQAFSLIILENFNSFSDDLKFLKFFLKAFELQKNKIKDDLEYLNSKIEEISIDCPFAKSNFNLLIYCINEWTGINFTTEKYDSHRAHTKFHELHLD